MANDSNWICIFDFLSSHLLSQETFSREDMKSVTNWTGSTFPTHFSKRLKQFLVLEGNDIYRVGESFRRFAGNWEQFNQQIATQVRKVADDYISVAYDAVLIFEFFMPLTHEGTLKKTLDALFYKDTVLNRLKSAGVNKIRERISINSDESDDDYLNRVCAWISDRFGGYSISHVSGRFRAKSLLSLDEVADLQKVGGRYLVDETTAIVRFIFPCGREIAQPSLDNEQMGLLTLDNLAHSPEVEQEAETIRWFFNFLFVQSIVQAVNGEDEIWMVESGMRSGLHVWRISD